MTKCVELQKDIYWLGVLDHELRVFDIIMETKFGTTYNAYLVKTTEGAVLVETVKEKFFDSYLAEIKSVIGDLSNVKYLISNHTEPDHAGSIMKFLEIAPHVQVVASRTAISYLKDITNLTFNAKAAEDLDGKLVVGDKTFEFISAPMLHWPDSMYSYLRNEKVLFTCDSFGSHYAPLKDVRISKLGADEEANYKEALHYYWAAIFGPFKSYMLKGIEKIKDLDIGMICLGHGPVLDARIDEIVGLYKEWSTVPEKTRKHKKVVITYCSAYGYTGEIADAIEKGIKEKDSTIEIIKENVHIGNWGALKDKLVAEVADADGVLLGTNTINGDALPFIWDLALSMNPITHGGKVVSAFGSYGWSGEGVDNIMDRLMQVRMKVMEGMKIKFRPSKGEIEQCIDFGKRFADAVNTGNVPPLPRKGAPVQIDYEKLNPTGKVVLWRCTVCGEIYAGVVPPEVCPACGVGQELFELYEPEEITFQSPTEEQFVIIGSSVAAVSAAEAIRKRAAKAKILLVTKESLYPYYRPILSDVIEKEVPESEFYLHPKAWYDEMKIEFKFDTEVTGLNTQKKEIATKGGETIKYDKLILAVGSECFLPPLPGHDLKGVFTLKYKRDADAIREYAKGKKRAVVIGGGVLGLEAADSLKNLGLEVTVLEFLPRVMPRQLEVGASAHLAEVLAKNGITLKTSVATKEIKGTNGAVSSVAIPDEEIPCDLVVISIGVRGNVKLASDAGIECDRGIIVDETMKTSAPDVWAAGDVIQLKKCGCQLWAPALEEGKVAGANAVGDKATFSFGIEPLSLLAFGSELFAVGVPPESDEGLESVTEEDKKTGRYVKLIFKDNKLVYGVMFNNTSKFPVVLSGVRQGHSFKAVLAQLYQ